MCDLPRRRPSPAAARGSTPSSRPRPGTTAMTTTGNAADSRPFLRVLGGFEVRVGGSPVTLPSNAQRVLGALAVTTAVVRRDVLAGKLWGLTSQSRAQANLRTALWRIGQAGDRKSA